jgi:cystathionine beta-lyase/cystathionine gamma-synthase
VQRQARSEFNDTSKRCSDVELSSKARGRPPAPRTRRFVYSRFTNPTVSMMQDRLAALEGADACIATASGMSAILAMSMALLKAGDHVICSNAVFGATVQLYAGVLGRFGVETTFVLRPTRAVAHAATTKLLFPRRRRTR